LNQQKDFSFLFRLNFISTTFVENLFSFCLRVKRVFSFCPQINFSFSCRINQGKNSQAGIKMVLVQRRVVERGASSISPNVLGILVGIALFKTMVDIGAIAGTYPGFVQELSNENFLNDFFRDLKVFIWSQKTLKCTRVSALKKNLLKRLKAITRDEFDRAELSSLLNRLPTFKARRAQFKGTRAWTRTSFLRMLSNNTNFEKCNPRALNYRKNFETSKTDLTSYLFRLFDKEVFDERLKRVTVEWDVLDPAVAGDCEFLNGPRGNRNAKIRLNSLYNKSPARVRDTLIHEMCHAAEWIICGSEGNHEAVWLFWREKAMRVYPQLPFIGITT
jgi:SprT-like family